MKIILGYTLRVIDLTLALAANIIFLVSCAFIAVGYMVELTECENILPYPDLLDKHMFPSFYHKHSGLVM